MKTNHGRGNPPDDHIAFTGKEKTAMSQSVKDIIEALSKLPTDGVLAEQRPAIADIIGVMPETELPNSSMVSGWENKDWDRWFRDHDFETLPVSKHPRYMHRVITRWKPTMGQTHSDFRWSMNMARDIRRSYRTYLGFVSEAICRLELGADFQAPSGDILRLDWSNLYESFQLLGDGHGAPELVHLLTNLGEMEFQQQKLLHTVAAGKNGVALPTLVSGPVTRHGAEMLDRTLKQMQKEFGWKPHEILASFYDLDNRGAAKVVDSIKRGYIEQFPEGDANEIRSMLLDEREAAKIEKKGNKLKKQLEEAPSHPAITNLLSRLSKHATANTLVADIEKRLAGVLDVVKAVQKVEDPRGDVEELDMALKSETVKREQAEERVAELEAEVAELEETGGEEIQQELEAERLKNKELVKGMHDLRKKLDAGLHSVIEKIDSVRVAFIGEDLRAIAEAVLEVSSQLEALGPAEEVEEQKAAG